MPAWLDYVCASLNDKTSCVLVNVVASAGSVPREIGARMVVTKNKLLGTIGGGQLEFEAIAQARARLEGPHASGLKTYPLGPELGQCCGGSVSLLFECLNEDDLADFKALQTASAEGQVARAVEIDGASIKRAMVDAGNETSRDELAKLAKTALTQNTAQLFDQTKRVSFAEPVREMQPALWLFGAGHVGKAVAVALAPLPFRLTWVDPRADMFPDDLPQEAHRLVALRPELAVHDAPKGAYFLVMTHSHPLDQDICEAVLKRADSAYLGLIGSKTKRAQFLSRLKAKGFNENQLSGLTCPIGLEGIKGKEPAIIATSVAADLLMRVRAN